MEIADKLAILADAAKYDASCASSGAPGRKSSPGGGIGSTTGNGICHSYTPDGRCVSLLKILLTNFCLYDCQYCVNRRSSDVERTRFTVDEVVRLTLDFYRRNYIEGLFLSSGIVKSPDSQALGHPARGAPAAAARASPLPGRLADASLRLQCGRDPAAGRQRDAAARHRSEDGLGARAS